MLIKCNNQWFNPTAKDRVMLAFISKEEKEEFFNTIRDMAPDDVSVAFFPDTPENQDDQILEWMNE